MISNRKFQRFLESELPPTPPEESLFHVIPAPYEKSVSYGKGTKNGPAAVLESSQQLELFDGVGIPAEHGIHTHPPINCEGTPENVLQSISSVISSVFELKKIPVLLGGEHTVSVGAFQSIKKHDKDVGIIQFDAHADLRDTYEGTPLSHACVMRRAVDLDIPVFQIGVRSLSYEEHCFRQKRSVGHLDASEIFKSGIPDQIVPKNFPKNIYITFDVDVFDPSIMPATGTPEPGGLNWFQVLDALASVVWERNVLGFDMVELAPIPGIHAPTFTIARLIYNLFGIIIRKIRN
jgi:agmatinase